MRCAEDSTVSDARVFVARIDGKVGYPDPASMPCGTSGSGADPVKRTVERLFQDAGWDARHAGQPDWSPMGELIYAGHTVVVKPNWVSHCNRSGQGMDCLVTHASVLGAMLDFVLRAKPGKIIVGDAPIQSCDLPRLMEVAGYSNLKQRYAQTAAPVEWRDFRRTILANPEGIWNRQTDCRPLEDYVLFDLGKESLLEPLAGDAHRFRVSMYDPGLMLQRHAPGRHQYLIARDVIAADVIVNLPKLKTHRKACVTGALKNTVGINGNKEYLPHHRRGGSRTGGDCYAGRNPLKGAAERLTDAANRREGMAAYLLRQTARGSYAVARLAGADRNLEGDWYGNDTVWRTCLDLNRILLYGRPDGTLSEQPQRQTLTLTDAIVCGEGEGPLAPTPRSLGMLTLACNPVAADCVHAHLMGIDWRRIPLIREAFGRFRYPLCTLRPEDVEVRFEGKWFRHPWPTWDGTPFKLPAGWKGHCERYE